jgi:hypothetical protein
MKATIKVKITQREKTHKCLANMQEHKLSECPSLKTFKEIDINTNCKEEI